MSQAPLSPAPFPPVNTQVQAGGKGDKSPKASSIFTRLSAFFFRRPGITLALLLAAPLLWLVIFYLGSLGALLTQSLFYVDDFSGVVVKELSLKTYQQLFTESNLGIVARTAAMAGAVTLAWPVIAFPLAYYMARFARGRLRGLACLSVLLRLW